MEFEEQPLIPETQLKRYFALAQNGDWVIKLHFMARQSSGQDNWFSPSWQEFNSPTRFQLRANASLKLYARLADLKAALKIKGV